MERKMNADRKIFPVGFVAGLALFMALMGAGYGQAHAQAADVPTGTAGHGTTIAALATYAQAQSGGLLTSAERVRIRVRFTGKAGADGARELAVRLLIASGWHVNANPASFEGLIPTQVQARVAGKSVGVTVSYPPGRVSNIRLEGKSLRVYDNGTVIRAQVSAQVLIAARAHGGLELVVTVQSCSDKGICLPPAKLIAHLRLGS
jgi:hypothetical protein